MKLWSKNAFMTHKITFSQSLMVIDDRSCAEIELHQCDIR